MTCGFDPEIGAVIPETPMNTVTCGDTHGSCQTYVKRQRALKCKNRGDVRVRTGEMSYGSFRTHVGRSGDMSHTA
jgi:hypothetical protein